MGHLGFRDAHSVHLPIDVIPSNRKCFRWSSQSTVAAQAEDHTPHGIGLLHESVDDFPRDELVDPDFLRHQLLQIGDHLFPNRHGCRLASLALSFQVTFEELFQCGDDGLEATR